MGGILVRCFARSFYLLSMPCLASARDDTPKPVDVCVVM
jgi:hypothetical protein